MSSPLLHRFATTVVDRLVGRGQLSVVEGRRDAVIAQLADHLGSVRHASLVSSISRALLASDDVEELFADDEDIKELVDDLDRREAGLARDG